jgi:peptidoglycan pentaglycine glycine transferase (the first glycine)
MRYAKMKIIEINDKNTLNGFIAANHGSFLQSWESGELHTAAGFRVFRLGLEEAGELVAAATLIKKPIGLGLGYYYCPKGPIVKATNHKKQASKVLIDHIRDLANKENCVFLRFEPALAPELDGCMVERTIDVQPSRTIILDLSRSEDELLADMHHKTRYNIRLAGKKGVEIRTGKEDLPAFLGLVSQTAERDGFRLHSPRHYERLSDLSFMMIYSAVYEGKVIAANMVSFFGGTATYVHGASGNEHRNLMAPFLLQWQAIRDAKAKGLSHYDFYGIDEAKWPGVTRFKRGFGGEEKVFPGTFDLVFDRIIYGGYKWLRTIRRKL